MSTKTPRHSGGRSESQSQRQKHRGQWILLDADLKQLLMIGSSLYPTAGEGWFGARSILDFTARRFLLPVMAEAVASGRSLDQTASDRQSPVWRCRAVPLLGAESGRPMAVLGCYDSPEASVEAPPVVGTWEWRVTSPGPDQQLHTWVSPAFHAVYGVNEGEDEPLDSSTWQDSFLAIEDRPASRAFFLGLLDADPRMVRFFDFTAVTRDPGPGIPLRCTGRRYEVVEEGVTWMGGLTFRRPAAEAAASNTANLRAALTLARDPLWLIDPEYEVIYASTDNLTTHELQVPETRHLPAMCHPQDLPMLRGLLQWVVSHPGVRSGPARFRFASAEGSEGTGAGTAWRVLEFVAYGAPISPTFTAIWCRVSASE